MNRPVNYLTKALDKFMADNNLQFNEEFILYDWRTKEIYAKAKISPMYMISFDDEGWRNDRTDQLLSGKYVVSTEKDENKNRFRGFELISSVDGAKLPERATAHSAGYDFFACRDQSIEPGGIAVVFTGVKAYMPDNEVLLVFNRSSNAKKKGLVLANGVGVVDSDYYNNPDNEGDIGFCFLNITDQIVFIKRGDKLGQAMFTTFGIADNDIAGGKRMGGYGSTDR